MLTITKIGLESKDEAFEFAENLFASLGGDVKVTVAYEVCCSNFAKGCWSVRGVHGVPCGDNDYEIIV